MNKLKFAVLLTTVFCLASILCVSSMLAQNQKPTAEQEFKNIQVLKSMPAEDLLKTMELMSAALGVRCDFCHEKEFEKDGKRSKQTARNMIKMTFEINKNNFNGRTEITCSSCHRGEEHPASFPALGTNLSFNAATPPNTARPKNPTIDEVLDKYYMAIGGKAALDKLSTRVMKVTRTDAYGKQTAEEFYQKPQNMVIVSKSAENPYTLVFMGSKDMNDDSIFTKDELEMMKRDEELFQPTKIKEVYNQLAVVGIDKINGKEVYLVRAATASGKRERLYFDKTTGLLVRRFMATPTVLGPFPIQVDYLDYKLVGGVKVPFTVQWSTAGRTWSRKVLDVKNNVAIDDKKFNPPVN